MSLDNAKHISIDGKSVIRLEIDGGVVWKGLPEGYTPLEYIEATGTQHVDLEFIPDQDTHIVCECMRTGGNGVYGARATVSGRNYALRVISGKWQPGYSTVSTSEVVADTEWHVFEQKQNVFLVDGVVAQTFDAVTFTSPKTFILGGINANGGVYYGEGRYRSCQRYALDGTLLMDVQACISPDGEIGMYDTVGAKFHGNAGTGEFVAGPEL